MATQRRPWLSLRTRRSGTRRANIHAVVLTGGAVAVLIGLLAAIVIRHERFLTERDGWFDVPWDESWPALPVAGVVGMLPEDVVRAVYAFAGRNPDVLEYVPCFCGCRLKGHRSNHDCYVARRSADGKVIEWNSHGAMCPIGPDITGDVMIRHHRGVSLSRIRQGIDEEFGSRGEATPTPHPPSY